MKRFPDIVGMWDYIQGEKTRLECGENCLVAMSLRWNKSRRRKKAA